MLTLFLLNPTPTPSSPTPSSRNHFPTSPERPFSQPSVYFSSISPLLFFFFLIYPPQTEWFVILITCLANYTNPLMSYLYLAGKIQLWMDPTFCFLWALLEKGMCSWTSNRPLIPDTPLYLTFPVQLISDAPTGDTISNPFFFLDSTTSSLHSHCKPYSVCSLTEHPCA